MQTIFLQQKLNGRNNMAWVKYGEDDLINLDKTTDIHIAKVQDEKGDYVYNIRFFYNNEDCLSTRYTSLEECTRDFEYLVRCLSFGIQFSDMTNIS